MGLLIGRTVPPRRRHVGPRVCATFSQKPTDKSIYTGDLVPSPGFFLLKVLMTRQP